MSNKDRRRRQKQVQTGQRKRAAKKRSNLRSQKQARSSGRSLTDREKKEFVVMLGQEASKAGIKVVVDGEELTETDIKMLEEELEATKTHT